MLQNLPVSETKLQEYSDETNKDTTLQKLKQTVKGLPKSYQTFAIKVMQNETPMVFSEF